MYSTVKTAFFVFRSALSDIRINCNRISECLLYMKMILRMKFITAIRQYSSYYDEELTKMITLLKGHEREMSILFQCILCTGTSFVVYWSEFLVTDQEIPGSII
jgi:hypothetical protein